MTPSFRWVPGMALLGTVLLGALSAADSDLNRMTPVSPDTAIPTQDFFRPMVMRSPSLNPAGTHLAAIVNLEEKEALVTIDLEKSTSELARGFGSFEIYAYHWLTDRRLIFSVSTEKLYGLGLLATEVGNLSKPYPIIQYMNARLISVPRGDRSRPLYWLSRDGLDEGTDVGPVVIETGGKTGRFINLNAAAWDGQDFAHVRDNNNRHILKYLPALAPKTFAATGYMADLDGKLNFGFTMENGHPFFHYLDGDAWKRSPLDLDKVSILASGSARDEVLVLGESANGKPSPVQRVNGRTGDVLGVVIEDPAYDYVGGPTATTRPAAWWDSTSIAPCPNPSGSTRVTRPSKLPSRPCSQRWWCGLSTTTPRPPFSSSRCFPTVSR